jgi:hypothetical protein
MKFKNNFILIFSLIILQSLNCLSQDILLMDNLKPGDTLIIDAINSSDHSNSDFGDRLLVFKNNSNYYYILLDNFYDLTYIDKIQLDQNGKWNLYLSGKLKYETEILNQTQIEKIRDLERQVVDKSLRIISKPIFSGCYLTITFRLKNKEIKQQQKNGTGFRIKEFLVQ